MRKIDERYYIEVIRRLRNQTKQLRSELDDYSVLVMQMIQKIQELQKENDRKCD